MIKIFNKRKVVNCQLPLTDVERQKVSDLKLMGYDIREVKEIKVAPKISRPKIGKDDIDNFLDDDLKKKFWETTKVQAVDKETQQPKYRTNKKGESVAQTIGFMGALRWLEKEHKSAYDQLVKQVEKENSKGKK